MKLTGGQAGGLRIDTPSGKRTRPSTDRMRESLFATLMDFLPGARVLDLFAGSGALGLEAASRGAEEVHWVERHGPTAEVIRRNVARLVPAGVACRAVVHTADAIRWLRDPSARGFHVVLADPPYADTASQMDVNRLCERIRGADVLESEGLLVLECEARSGLEAPDGWELLKRKDYGATCVLLLDPVSSSSDSTSPSD